MSGGNENDKLRPVETRPKKYYWPWECNLPRIRFSLTALILLVTAAAFGSCCIGLAVRETRGTNLTAEEANHRMRHVGPYCCVPEGATNIDLRAWYNATTMSFDMPFSDFAGYCAARDWHLRQIDPMWPQSTHDIDYKPLTITNGYYYRNRSHSGGGFDVFYDMSTQRGWIHYSRR
jgi:hypothetical protein